VNPQTASDPGLKPVIWVGSSLSDLKEFPGPVQDHMGYALYVAQLGGKHGDAKALTGFGGAGVIEVLKDYRGDTFRAVYTVRFARAPFVLHAFQKKSKTGRQTPQGDMGLIRLRLRDAERIAKEMKP
jgi:phage-related protein